MGKKSSGEARGEVEQSGNLESREQLRKDGFPTGKYRSGHGQGSSQSEGCRGGNREGAEGGVTRAGGRAGRNAEGRKGVLAALSLIERAERRCPGPEL